MIVSWWPAPEAGDIVWCHFPDNINPKPKPRPALILTVFEEDIPQFSVEVVYGTSQRITELYRGEFAICKTENAAAYKEEGLSYDTKFDLKQSIRLPYSTQWFSVPPGSLTQNPKLGLLHPSMMRALEAAYRAARSQQE